MNARLAALAAVVLTTGCQSFSAPDSVLNGTAVVTQYTPGTQWSSYTNVMVDPSITVVDGTGTVQTTCSVDGSQLAPTIEQLMASRGYTVIPWDPNPASKAADLQVKMTASLGSQTVYYGGGYCGWYPYYYCYPGWTYAGSYSFGTLELAMGDVKNATAGQKLPLVWAMAGYGILAGYYSGCSGNGSGINWSRIQEAVVRAFDQSPYIMK